MTTKTTTAKNLEALLLPGITLIYLSKTESTNDYLAANIATEQFPCAVISEHQSKGKGQRQNTWASEKGTSLTFSLGLYFQGKQVNPLWSLVFALTVCETLNELTKQTIQIKWPNDLYINGAKFAGILIESFADDGGVKVITGIGINLKTPAGQFDYPVTAFASSVDNAVVYANIINNTIKSWQQFLMGEFNLIDRFKQHDYLYNHKITLTDNVSKQTQIGIAKGIDGNGYLLIDTKQGLKKVINQHRIRVINETIL